MIRFAEDGTPSKLGRHERFRNLQARTVTVHNNLRVGRSVPPHDRLYHIIRSYVAFVVIRSLPLVTPAIMPGISQRRHAQLMRFSSELRVTSALKNLLTSRR